MLQRDDKRVIAQVVDSSTAHDIIPIIRKYIESVATIYSDEWRAYKKFLKYYVYEHEVVMYGKGQYIGGEKYINNIENFWSQLKRAIIGVYRVTSEKHLQSYVDEFVFRRNTMEYTTKERFVYLLKNTKGYRLTYNQLKKAC